MISLQKSDVPDELQTRITERTTQLLRLLNAGDEVPQQLKNAYKSDNIKELVKAETYSKCAYCESKVPHVYFGDIEHIKPKTTFPELTFAYDNLTLVCAVCNNNKRDYFNANTPLINPYIDDPQDYLIPLGPLIMHKPGSEKGRLTESIIKLNRPDLLERRKERIESVSNLADAAALISDEDLRKVLREQLLREGEADKEYALIVRGYLASIL